MKLLYVEDNPINAAFLSKLVERHWGVHLTVAGSAEAGLALLMQEKYDLLYLDISLPKMSGLDLLIVIRDDPELQKIPVMMVSADASDGTIQNALNLGANAFLAKPLDQEKFILETKRLISEKSSK